jgi:hypothetical protein
MVRKESSRGDVGTAGNKKPADAAGWNRRCLLEAALVTNHVRRELICGRRNKLFFGIAARENRVPMVIATWLTG